MMPSKALIVLQLAMGFSCSMSLDAVSIVNIFYSSNNSSSDTSVEKHLEVGTLELHLEGRALIDYHRSEVNESKHSMRFVVKDAKLSDKSYQEIKTINKNDGLGYTLTLTPNKKNGQEELVVECIYDPEQIKLEHRVGDVINGNGSFTITLQNQKILRALSANHKSILQLAHKSYHTTFYLCC